MTGVLEMAVVVALRRTKSNKKLSMMVSGQWCYHTEHTVNKLEV